MYKAILLDLDNTLIDYTRSESEALSYIYKKFYEKSYSYENFYHIFKKINTRLWTEYKANKITIDALRHERFNALTKTPKTQEKIHDIVSAFESYLGSNVYLFDDCQTFIQNISKNFQLCIASNGINAIQQKKLTVAGMAKYIDHIFISENIGCTKPNKEFFESILQTLQLKNTQILMVGDSLNDDLIGAANAHLDFCWINRSNQKLPHHYPTPTYTVSSLKELDNILSE